MRIPFPCSADEIQAVGLSCTQEEPCAVYVELSGVESVGNRIFLTGNIHTASATLSSLLLASDDAGKTWSEPYQRMRFAVLEQIQFIDFETGWIAGSNLQGVPRNPFFLMTGDGGKTWTERPVFEEDRAGVIEHFWFESRTEGTMLLDTRLHNRHELYESKTGGREWSLRQVSGGAIRFPRQREESDLAWRIRADSKTHSYHIEKHQAGHWQPVAGFVVEMGKCAQ